MMKTAAGAVAAVVIFACAMLVAFVLPHPQYTPDGMVYARYAAHDAGLSERDATLAVRTFYERTPLMKVPRYRALVEIDPSLAFARSHIFSNRILYPALVAPLLRPSGFRALWLVSALSYVAFGVSLLVLLWAFVGPWLAATLTIAALALPLTRTAAASDLTDMLALFWWTLALAAIVHGTRDRRRTWALVAAAASVLLALTRPAPYLTVLPAAAAAIVSGAWALLWAPVCGIVSYAIVAAAVHAFGVAQQLDWVYAQRPASERNVAEGVWYRSSLAGAIKYTVIESVRTILPVAAFVAWVISVRTAQTRRDAIVLAAAAAACAIAVPFNPVPSSIDRVVFLPLIPVFFAALACAARSLRVSEPLERAPDIRLYRRSAPVYSHRPLDRSG
ncbi:MAG TPA: hypothetical protein VGZ02_16000 [Candidatus Baltobacteraceae bacterium]|nr:hypothetical protein [Candidatus Baltobacteraceae bacterium]